METLDSPNPTAISTAISKLNSPNPTTQTSPTPTRLWRPAAQRNLRNQWSKLLVGKDRWISMASEGRSNANGLINAYLSRRYMPEMNLGVLKDMPGIRQKACRKFTEKQALCHTKLLSSYKDMVDIVSQLVKTSSSMRCFLKGSATSSVLQFCNYSEDENDLGDGGGTAVFSSWSILYFESLAQELVEMFILELNFKRLLVVELLSVSCQDDSGCQADALNWSDELYPREYDDMSSSYLLSKESHQPFSPRIKDWASGNNKTVQPNLLPNREVLQVYLTAWLSDVNIDMSRVEDIFAMVGEEMQVKLS